MFDKASREWQIIRELREAFISREPILGDKELRSRLKSPPSSQTPQHQVNHGQLNHSLSGFRQHLVIFAESSVMI